MKTKNNASRLVIMSIVEIHDHKNHPFQVVDDDKMHKMVNSVIEYGVIVPAVVRPRKEGGYELVSGHRRKRACEIAGVETMPVIIRELDNDEATILMADSNLQREGLLPSERAFAFRMKMEALKRQGMRNNHTLSQIGTKFQRTDEMIADQSGMSRNQIHRFIRLTELIPELLAMVDDKKIAFNPAVELSYLIKGEQKLLFDIMEYEQSTPSLSQAQRMKHLS